MTTAQKLMTVEEFQELPDSPSGERMELVRGVLTMAPPAGTGHGKRAFRIGKFLDRFVELHSLGEVTGEGGYLLAEDPDVVRAPDSAWLANDRRERPSDRPTGYFKGAPNLAVEVVSDTDRDSDVSEKVQDFLRFGCDRVWVVRPRQETVTVFRAGGDAHVYSRGDTLTSAGAGFPLDGFELSLAQIFA